MTDPMRRDAGIPIIGSTSQQSPVTSHEGDEPYIRDVAAANFGVEIKDEAAAAALCEGEKIWCEMCGAEFPLWPIRHWAVHYTQAHHDEITIQHSAGVSQFCMEGLTQLTAQWLSIQIMHRVSMRRRARDLGLIRFNDRQPGGSN
jgi:hypothetical protein